jgi:hypothetical protein
VARSHLRLVTPTTKKRTVRPKRPPNADLRTREYLTEAEGDKFASAFASELLGMRQYEAVWG